MTITWRSEKVIPNRVYFQQVVRLLAEDKQVRIPIKGKSMQPFLREGDLVVLKKNSGNHFPLGSVVLGQYQEGVVLHRLVGRQFGQLRLAGDGNLIQEEVVGTADILGIVVSASREGRQLNLSVTRHRLCGLVWYYLRPLRRVFLKLHKLTRFHE